MNKIGNSVRITSGFQEYVYIYIYILIGHLPPHNVTQPLKTDTLAPENLSVRVVRYSFYVKRVTRIQVSSTIFGHDISSCCALSSGGQMCIYSVYLHHERPYVCAQPIIPLTYYYTIREKNQMQNQITQVIFSFFFSNF